VKISFLNILTSLYCIFK